MSGLASARRIPPARFDPPRPPAGLCAPAIGPVAQRPKPANRPRPRFRFMPASPKCPPAASASPAMAMPRRERIGGAIANAGAEQGERVRRSTYSGRRVYECEPIAR